MKKKKKYYKKINKNSININNNKSYSQACIQKSRKIGGGAILTMKV